MECVYGRLSWRWAALLLACCCRFCFTNLAHAQSLRPACLRCSKLGAQVTMLINDPELCAHLCAEICPLQLQNVALRASILETNNSLLQSCISPLAVKSPKCSQGDNPDKAFSSVEGMITIRTAAMAQSLPRDAKAIRGARSPAFGLLRCASYLRRDGLRASERSAGLLCGCFASRGACRNPPGQPLLLWRRP